MARITVPVDDVLKLVKEINDAGLKAKPEVAFSSACAARPSSRA